MDFDNGMAEEPKTTTETKKDAEPVTRVGIPDNYNHHVNPFTNKYELFKFFGITKKDADNWRLVEPVTGEIHGLPNSHGTLLATNGMLCIISADYTNRSATFEGHLDYFIADRGEREIRACGSADKFLVSGKVKAERAAKNQAAVSELLDSLFNL